MILQRGIARAAGRALAVQRANAALFGSLAVAPRSNPSANQQRTSPRASAPWLQGTAPLLRWATRIRCCAKIPDFRDPPLTV
jgi:hypothetical protein